MKYLFTLATSLIIIQFSSAQVNFYVGNQLLDNSQAYQFTANSSSATLVMEVENGSNSIQVLTVDVCVLQDVPQWEMNSLIWGHEDDPFGGTHFLVDHSNDPCWLMSTNVSAVVELDTMQRGDLVSYFDVYGTACELYRYYVMDNGAAIDSIDVQTCSVLGGVNDVQAVAFSIAPNPVTDYVQIALTSVSNAEYAFINTSGQVVKTGEIDNFEGSVNVDDLEGGYYFIRLKTDDGVYHRKLLVSKEL